jgi:hypothetical protein
MTTKSTKHRTRGPLASLARACVRARWLVTLTWLSIIIMFLVVTLETGGAFVASSIEPDIADLRRGLWAILPVALLSLLVLGAVSTTGAVVATAGAGGFLSACTAILLSNVIDMGPYSLALSVIIGGSMAAAWGVSISTRYLASRSLGRDAERGSREALASAGRAIAVAVLTAIAASALMSLVGGASIRGSILVTASSMLMAGLALTTLMPALYAAAGDRVEKYATGRAANTSGGLHRWTAITRTASTPMMAAGGVVALLLGALIFRADIQDLTEDHALASIPRLVGMLFVIGIATVGGLTIGFRSLSLAIRSYETTILSLLASTGLATAVYSRSAVGATDADGLAVVLLVVLIAGLTNDALLAGRLRRGLLEGEGLRQNLERSTAAACQDALMAGMAIALTGLVLMRSAHGGLAVLGLALAVTALADALLIRCVIVPAATHYLGTANFSLPNWADVVIPVEPDAPSPERVLVSNDKVTEVKGGNVVSAANLWAAEDKPRETGHAKTAASSSSPGLGARAESVDRTPDEPPRIPSPMEAPPAEVQSSSDTLRRGDTDHDELFDYELSTPNATPEPPVEKPAAQPAAKDAAVRGSANEPAVDQPAASPSPARSSSPPRMSAGSDPLDDPYLAALSRGRGFTIDEPDVTLAAGPTEHASSAEPPAVEIPVAKPADTPAEETRLEISDDKLDPSRLNGLPELFQRIAVLEDDNHQVLERIARNAEGERRDVLAMAARFSSDHRDTAIECFDEVMQLGAEFTDIGDTSSDTSGDQVTDRASTTSIMQLAALDLLAGGTLHPEAAEELRWWLDRSVGQWNALERAGIVDDAS